MKRLFSLVKVMSKASLQSMNSLQGIKTKKGDSKLKRFGTYALILFLIIYFIGIIYVPSRYIINGFVKLGQPSLTISILYTFAPILMIFFAILSIPGVFYFSKDIEDYLPLPFSSTEIIIAKYITAYIQSLSMVALIFIPIFYNYFTLVNPGISFIFISLFTIFLIPLIPLSIALIVVAILMRFVPFLKNKDLYIYISTGLIFIPTFVVVFAMSSTNPDADLMEVILASLENMDDSLFRQISIFFPTSHMFTLALVDFNFMQLALASIISFLSVLVSIVLVSPLYFKSVIGIDEKTSKKRRLRLNEMDQGTKVKSFTQSFMLNDFRKILRTPTFAINYFSAFLVMPLILIIPLLTQRNALSMVFDNFSVISDVFHEFFYKLDLINQIELPLLVGLGLGIFIANFESTSSTAISREGLALKNYLTLPIKLSDITHAKARLSMIFSSIYSSIFVFMSILFLRPKLITILLFLITFVVGIVLSTYLAILVDVLFPSVIWETEQQAVKGNFIQVLVMLPLMFIPLLFVALFFLGLSWLNIVIALIFAPLLAYILIIQSTKASNTKLKNRIQNL